MVHSYVVPQIVDGIMRQQGLESECEVLEPCLRATKQEYHTLDLRYQYLQVSLSSSDSPHSQFLAT